MRVALHHPARREDDGTQVPPSISAFRLGRIEDRTDPVTAEVTPAEETAAKLAEVAEQEHPECEVVIERLVDNGDGSSRWVPESEVTPEMVAPGGKPVAARELEVEQGQNAVGGEAS